MERDAVGVSVLVAVSNSRGQRGRGGS
uniref:Uncharacterized protein n=1 Tax=Arundo donax TaxID=35708 RepID=A0A0A9E8B5_ARUDO